MRPCQLGSGMNNRIKALIMKDWMIKKFAPAARVTLFVGALAVGVSGLAWIHPSQAKEETAAAAPIHLKVNEQPVSRDAHAVTSFAPVVKKVAPSVVKVFVTGKAKVVPSAEFSPFEDPFF